MTGNALPPLEADFELGFTYTRTLGPVIGRCFAALGQKRLLGMRRADGSVLFPPLEYDPDTAEPLGEWVELDDTGTVVSHAWVAEPRAKHPLQHPFAFALVLLDGADTPFLHVVDCGSESAIRIGMRVKARWLDEPRGDITDIAAFVPEDEADG